MDDRTKQSIEIAGDLGNRVADYLTAGIKLLDEMAVYRMAQDAVLRANHATIHIDTTDGAHDRAFEAARMMWAIDQLTKAIKTNGQDR
jgi:hypothetical protein